LNRSQKDMLMMKAPDRQMIERRDHEGHGCCAGCLNTAGCHIRQKTTGIIKEQII
jgi:hypothetical protein